MKRFLLRKYLLFIVLALTWVSSYGQAYKGALFIIGGGDRPPQLMKALIETAQLRPTDYIVVLPMATSIPEESVAYFKSQIKNLCGNYITSFNFNREQADHHQAWIDSVRNARLIYITGGDQNKFMKVVYGTRLYDAMHEALRNGATISGTSAGAAVMSQIMITGEEREDKKGSFKDIKKNNTITSQGMGFITGAIIDQHFIKRSRHNRLISLLADHPNKKIVGIDESTAIIVKGKEARVVGENQVLVIASPKNLKTFKNNKVAFKNANFSLFSEGDKFAIK
ncbi:Peptidase E [Mycovorax composti]|uniref:Cyanophycinase n=1 Tax=Mycovorax composti TaxID=2962693 RepID=A0ABZ2ENG0_9BACT